MQVSGLITGVKTIAERLTWARVQVAKLSQEELAKKAGVTQGTIGNVESGARKNPRELLAIARAAGVHAEWLKSGKGPAQIAETSMTVEEPRATYRLDTVHAMAELLAQSHPRTRKAALALLGALVDAPEDAAEIASEINHVLANGAPAEIPATPPSRLARRS